MMELTVVLPRTAALVLCLLITGEAFMWEDNQVTVSKISEASSFNVILMIITSHIDHDGDV